MCEHLSKDIIIKFGQELKLPMIYSLTDEERKIVDESDTDSIFSNYYTVLKSFYKDFNLLNITIFDPYCGLFGRGRRALGTFNIDTMKWTRKSAIQTELSSELLKMISELPVYTAVRPTENSEILIPISKKIKNKPRQKFISDYFQK